MDIVMELLRQAGNAVLQLILQPFYYIGVLILLLLYFRQTRMERKLFHVRLHIWPILLFQTLLIGIATGGVVSAAAAFIGVTLQTQAVYWLWGTAVVLLLFRIRYFCFAYSVGLLGLLQWSVSWIDFEFAGTYTLLQSVIQSLEALDIPGLLLLVGLLHLAEALLVRWRWAQLSSPILMMGKRGKIVGGYQLQGYWPIPLLLLVPAQSSSAAAVSIPWTPLLGGDLWSMGWLLLGLPLVIGVSAKTHSLLPREHALQTSRGLLLLGLLLLAAAALSVWLPVMTAIAAIIAIGLHEALIWLAAAREAHRIPLYVHHEQGLRILAVVPGTAAEELGILAGESIHKVNGSIVRTEQELYEALHANSAFCKLEIINHEGHSKFLQRARYDGEHHQLGVILAPNEQTGFYIRSRSATMLDLLRSKRTGGKPNQTTPL